MTVDDPRVEFILKAMNRKYPQSLAWYTSFQQDGSLLLQGDTKDITVPKSILEMPSALDTFQWIVENAGYIRQIA